jgi:hypothetical protein
MIYNRDLATVQLALFAWREGQRLSPGCRAAMKGIAHVISNRVQRGWHNGDWLKVLEFVPATSSDQIAVMEWRSQPDPESSDFREILNCCDRITGFQEPDDVTVSADVAGAAIVGPEQAPAQLRGLYYAYIDQLRGVVPMRDWFKTNILSQPQAHPRTASAGNVQFFS